MWIMISIGLQNFTALGTVLLPACEAQLVSLPEILQTVFSLIHTEFSYTENPGRSPTTGFTSVQNQRCSSNSIQYHITLYYNAIYPRSYNPLQGGGTLALVLRAHCQHRSHPQRCNFRIKDLRRWFGEPSTCTAREGACSCSDVVAHSGLRCNCFFPW